MSDNVDLRGGVAAGGVEGDACGPNGLRRGSCSGRGAELRVLPVKVGAADVSHLDLPAFGVVGRVGEHAALEGLHEHPAVLAGGFDLDPVWLGDRVAHGEDPVDYGAVYVPAILIDDALLVEETPEDVGDIVACGRLVRAVAGQVRQVVKVNNAAVAGHTFADLLACAHRGAVRDVYRGDLGQRNVRGRVGAVGVARDGDVGALHGDELLVARL